MKDHFLFIPTTVKAKSALLELDQITFSLFKFQCKDWNGSCKHTSGRLPVNILRTKKVKNKKKIGGVNVKLTQQCTHL